MDAIHFSGVFGWIEQPNVSFQHMQVGKPSVCGLFSQDLAGIGIPLNSDNWGVTEDEIGKQSSSNSGE